MLFPYAETHFKFRLPWSPLHMRWPEIFLDAPHQVLPGKPFGVYLLIKDADLYPVKINSLKLRLEDSHGCFREFDFDLDLVCDENLTHRTFPLSLAGLNGLLRVFGWIKVESNQGKSACFLSHNFPGLESGPLEIRLLEHPRPYPADWQAGEMHCHSEFSSDMVEFGAPLSLMQEAAETIGLDFALCSDHSYDFHYRRERYLQAVNPEDNFAAYRTQAEALNAKMPAFPTLIPGEEVSCGNSRGENVHLLVFGNEVFLPGLGDGGRRGFNNRPDLKLEEVLHRLRGIPAFAAHPKKRIGWLERKVFRRGEWRDEDLKLKGIRGLQFWNGNLGLDYHEGKSFWIRQLLQGRRLLPIGANDAHGDFNRNIGVKLPLVSLYQTRDHVFGKVRTLIPCSTRDIASLRAAFLGDTCVCTDGPFIGFTRSGGNIRVEANSNGDFGAWQSVRVYGAAVGEKEEKLCREWTFKQGPMELEEPFPAPLSGYARVEAATQNGNRALSSALFLD